MKLLVAVLLSLTLCVNATFKWGPCPSPALQANFNITNYYGVWYELVRNIDMPFEKGDCTQAEYSPNPDGTVRVFNSEIYNGKNESAIGYAYCDADQPAKCNVKFSKFSPAGDYSVVYTDYENFSLVLSCSSIGIAHWEWAWVLARKIEPVTSIESFVTTINSFGIPTDALYFTSHSNCPNA